MKSKLLFILCIVSLVMMFSNFSFAQTEDTTYVFSGKIEETAIDINGDTNLIVFWDIPEPPSFYAFGTGEITAEGDSFELSFSRKPPLEALVSIGNPRKDGFMGVGTIFFTNQNIEETLYRANYNLEENMIGAASNIGILYFEEPNKEKAQSWVKPFGNGYQIGKLISIEHKHFKNLQGFDPVHPDSISINIQDIKSFEFPHCNY